MPRIIRITTVPLSLHVLLRGQLRYMKEKGLDVIMVSADGKEWEHVLADEGCPHVIVPMTRKITPFKDLQSLYRLTKLFRRLKPDIVHSHTPKAGLLAMMAASFAGIKIRIHTIAGLRFVTAHGYTRKILRRMEMLTARYATHVWPNSSSLLEYIRKNGLVPERKLELIGAGSSNGIDLSRYSESALQPQLLDQIRSLIHYDPSLYYFLSVGRIVQDKGINELVDAFVILYEKNAKIRLVLVGAFEDELDPVEDRVKKIISKHPGIMMAGWSDKVEYFMHLAYALVHPSYREGFPNVLLQAGSMNCPVICSRIEGNIDIVEHKKTGLLFEVKNVAELVEQMEYALANETLMQQYAMELRRKIEKNFDQPLVHRLLYKRYLELLGT